MVFSSFSSLLLFAFILHTYSNECSACLAEEKTALLKIKTSFYVPGNSWPLNWDDKVDCCRWERVNCDSITGRITQLLLNGTWEFSPGQEHVLNSTLFLPFLDLQYLDLSSNSIDGCIPSSGFEAWFSLRKLEVLDLSGNSFNESVIISLAKVFSLKTVLLSDANLSNFIHIKELSMLDLEVLDLSFNKFSGSLGDLGNWPSLKSISLHGNSFNGTLPTEELCKMINLQELDLSHNEFTGDLPSCIENLTSLTFLDLSQNQFQIKFPNSIFTKMISLKYLSLSENQLEGILYFNSFSNHSKLKILELTSKDYNFKVETEFPKANPSFQLEGLELSNCNLNSNNSGSRVPSFLLNQIELYYLDLSHNNLGGSFPDWLLGNNINLLYLNLRNNTFEGSLVFPSQIDTYFSWLDASQNKLSGELPNDMYLKIPHITFLNLSRNYFQGPLPPSFIDLSFIYMLDISHNNISDHIENAFLGNLSRIHSLFLSNNRFYGSLSSLEKVHIMIDLALDNNFITGEIPNDICDITYLTYIDMSNNKLNGTIPNCLIKIAKLEILNLRNNSLEGSIPTTMCNLSNLQFLDLSQNNLAGPIPSCFNISKLQYLHLSQNSFSGQFPISLSNSPDLRTIDIRGNKFSGTIPNWINISFLKLRVFLLGGNQFDGRIPDQICDFHYLLILDLSSNFLSGRIPKCLSKMGSVEGILYSFQYSNSYGSGAELLMPYYEPALKFYMKTYSVSSIGVDQEEFMTKSRNDYYQGEILNYLSGIDLSSNLLEGPIPEELGSMNWILALNLSNNHLTGNIPKSLSNLTDLESMDLSHNDLTGQIPTELAKLNFLESFSVAYNNLSGSILNGGQFSSFDESSFEGNPNLCGPPLVKICTTVPPASPNGDGTGNSKNDDLFDLLMMVGSFVLSFVLGFWGFIVVIYYKRNWNQALFLAVDKYTDLILMKITLLMRRLRAADE